MDRKLTHFDYHDLSTSLCKTGDVPIAVSICNGIIDCMYYGSAVLVDKDGTVVWHIGNLERLVYERSLVKPFRAVTIIKEGVIDEFSLDEKDIAVIAGSHSGTSEHTTRVRTILDKCGLTLNALKCGIRLPLGDDGLWGLPKRDSIDVCQCDCSGEHAGILALCRHMNFPTENYLDVTHPVQKMLKHTILEFSTKGFQYNPQAIDRCGMPIAAVPLNELASRFLNLIMKRKSDQSVNYLVNSILKNPYLFTGRGRLIGELIVRSNGNIIGKDGAEGVYTIAWINQGLCMAVKVGSGVHKAALPIMYEAASAVGLDLPDVWDCINLNEFSKITGINKIIKN